MSKVVLDKELSSKYKSYVSQVDKALKSFESTNDWADLIVPLGRLNKVLEANIKHAVIPRKTLISKRLAQCLHHSLPSGVHLKALETFDIIFRSIGTSGLAKDVFIYTTGLFPLLSYAAINVRPTLLTLFEAHLVPLGGALKPAITGIIMALLPGLENGSEFYDRINRLLDSVCRCVDKSHFYTCLWQCIQVSSSIRFAGLSYIAGHFDRKQNMDDQIYIMGSNVNLLVQSLCSSLEDSTPLVQRCLLDLLVSCFPIHNCQLPRSDISKVMVCSVGVLLRRDMSLSRRLVAWLMGTDINGNQVAFTVPQINGTVLPKHFGQVQENNVQYHQNSPQQQNDHMDLPHQQHELTYFNIFTRDLLIQAITTILSHNDKKTSSSLPDLPSSYSSSLNRPLYSMKLIISLLDRPEIVSPILSDLLLEILRSMYRDCVGNLKENVERLMEEKVSNGEVMADAVSSKVRGKEKSAASDVLKTASILFNHFDPSFIWAFICKLFQEACFNSIKLSSSSSSSSSSLINAKPITVTEFTEIINFLIDKLSANHFLEVHFIHFPVIISSIISTISSHTNNLPSCDLISSLQLCSKILSKITKHSQELPLMKQRLLVAADSHMKPCRDLKEQMARSTTEGREVGSTDDDSATEPSGDDRLDSDSDNKEGRERKREDDEGRAESRTPVESCKRVVFSFIDSYLAFFHSLVHSRLLSDPCLEACTIDYLLHHSNKQASMHTFKRHLAMSLGSTATFTSSNPSLSKLNISSSYSDQLLLTACRLLERCLSIPTYDIHFINTDLPPWFKSLLSLCCVSHDHFNTQFISLNCLFSLLKQWKTFVHNTSQQRSEEDNDPVNGSADNEDGGADDYTDLCCELHFCYLEVLNEKTCFFKLVAESVWENMSRCLKVGSGAWRAYNRANSRNTLFIRGRDNEGAVLDERVESGANGGSLLKHVQLFNSIHQHSPHVCLCEEVVTCSMLSNHEGRRSAGLMHFMAFWDCLKDLNSLGRQKFDRCIIILLENLCHENHLLSCLASDWVVSCFKDPSFVHLLEPVLKILLHPDTARVSVQHLNNASLKVPAVERTQSVETYEPPIVAVSNEGGHIVYHIDNKRRFKNYRKPQELNEADLTTTPLEPPEVASLKKAELLIDNYLATNRQHNLSVNLQVNPFLTGVSSEAEVVDVLVDGVVDEGEEGLDACFEDEEEEEDEDEAVMCSFDEPDYQVGSFRVVTSLLDDIITNVVSNSLLPLSPQVSEMNNSTDFSDFMSCEVLREDERVSVASISDDDDEDAVRSKNGVQRKINESGGAQSHEDTGLHSSLGPALNANITVNNNNNDNNIKKCTDPKNSNINCITINNTSTTNNKINYNKSSNKSKHTRNPSTGKHIHPLKSYILLYRRKYDQTRVLCALQLLRNIISTQPKLVISALINTPMNNKHCTIKIIPSSDNSYNTHNLVDLFIRHKQSILGHDFHHSLPYDIVDTLNDSTYLELLLFVLIYFVRAFFNDSLLDKLTFEDLAFNRQVHVSCCQFLSFVFNQLCFTVQQAAKVAYKVSELLIKSKVQKTILYSIHSHASTQQTSSSSSSRIEMRNADKSNKCGGVWSETCGETEDASCDLVSSGVYMESFLDLAVSLVQLEEQIRLTKADNSQESLPREFELMYESSMVKNKNDQYLFLTGHSIIYQPILLDSIMQSLSTPPLPSFHLQHQMWIRFVLRLMPHLHRASTKVLSLAILHISQHLDYFHQHALPSSFHKSMDTSKQQIASPNKSLPFCTKHYSFLLTSLSSIYHYCIFESSLHSHDTSLTSSANELQKPSLGGQFMSGLVSALTFQALSRPKRSSALVSSMDVPSMPGHHNTPMLALLPNILTTCYHAFTFVNQCQTFLSEGDNDDDDDSADEAADGAEKSVNVDKQWLGRIRQAVLDLLNPISCNFLPVTLASFSLLWNEHCSFSSYEQMALLNALKHIVKQPVMLSAHANKSKQMSLETGMLRMLFEFIKQLSHHHHGDNHLSDTCGRVVAFVKEVFPALQASADHPAIFVLISLFHYVLVKSPMVEEKKKDGRDLHEFTNRLLESCSSVVAMSLEQGTFFRRSLAVKSEAIPTTDAAKDDLYLAAEEQNCDRTSLMSSSTLSLSHRHISTQSTFSLSVQALLVLADVAATLLDVVYQSDEKEKESQVSSNIILTRPSHSLFHHSTSSPNILVRVSNNASYAASSRLLANLSGYQYSRRSWKRECLELLTDCSFFQMDLPSLVSWTTIVDNLMSHDKFSFQDLLARFSLTQSSSLNLFSSRDGEMEVRRQLIKRVSFAIFCSETDQYSKCMPDIQEKLSESLRYSNYPLLQAEVFNCFRVLLLKMTSFPLAPLWPTIINELTQVLLSIECKIEALDSDDLSRNYQTTDLLVTSDDKTNTLYVSACKLLDLLLTLPPEHLPRFQLYKWAFVGDASSDHQKEESFVPHALKITQLMHKKYGPGVSNNSRRGERLVPHKIESLKDLQDFFTSVCVDFTDMQAYKCFEAPFKMAVSKSQIFSDLEGVNRSDENSLEVIKHSILLEFVEKMN